MNGFLETLTLASALSTLFIAGVVAIEFLRRKFGYSPEITRRVVHIFSGLCTILDYLLLPSVWFLILISTSLIGIALSQKLGWLTSVHNVKRRTFGEVFLPVGSLTTYLVSAIPTGISNPKYFLPALLIMTFADAAAGITSDLLKLARKSWQGSAVFFAVTVLILAAFETYLPIALFIAAALTGVERISKLGSDNFTVPAVAAALLRLF